MCEPSLETLSVKIIYKRHTRKKRVKFKYGLNIRIKQITGNFLKWDNGIIFIQENSLFLDVLKYRE